VTELHFLGYPDGRLQPTLELRRDLSRVIRIVRPQRVLCQSPIRNFERIFASHPDHLAAGEAALCAVYPDARNAFTFTELIDAGHEPWSVAEVWMMAAPDASHAVDVTATVERKMAALRHHQSQLPDPAAMESRVRGWLQAVAAQHDLAPGSSAEVFSIISTA
jgi:LmbE family N-acetylglucosaminyl deacetylase